MTDNYSIGVWVLGMYAAAGNLSQASVVAAFKARYAGTDGGQGAVEALGALAKSVSAGALQTKIRDLSHDNQGSVDVSVADLNQVMLDLGAVGPSIAQVAGEAVAQTGKEVATGAAVIGTAAAGGYLVWMIFGSAILGFIMSSVKRRT